ncbi:MAG: hypothetical protein P1U85_22765 [Verrucomicrobiales bacterium]|jgi:hypothetical protein|nr:hypothetical protein [Verrucomicrobiales bacterium]
MKTTQFTQLFFLIPFLSIGLISCVVDDTGTEGSANQVSGASTNEEGPATDPVPQKVIDDCLAKLKTQIPDREMKVISARRGETSFIVDVEVTGVPEPWRCYHDGTNCTGTEYQGEG